MLSPWSPNMLNPTNKNQFSCPTSDYRVCGAGVSQTATIMCTGAAERALGWESADLSSRPGFVTAELSDLGQVTSSLGASFLFSKMQGEGGDLKFMISF